MNRITSIALFAILLSLTHLSCSRSNNDVINDISPIISTGEWMVTNFSERGINETADFSGFSFVFQAGGKLMVNKSGSVFKEGSWSEDKSSGKLIINLGIKDNTNKPLGELTDDWVITAKSETRINRTDDNSASNEFLEFSKK
jgi:hypothetical protein